MAAVLVFTGALCVMLYVLFVYPLLLGYWARHAERPVRRAHIRPSVSIILAVYNGEAFLENKLRSILALDYPREQLEVLVASDGSTDQTNAIAQSFATEGVRLLRLPRGGKSVALNAAIRVALGEILVLTDVRQLLARESVGYLVEAFADPAVGAVSGELMIREGATHQELDIGLYWKFEKWIRKSLSAIDSIFGATGALYAMRRDLAVPIPSNILLDDMYLPLSAFFNGYRLIMDPRALVFDSATALNTEFRRKVRTLAGNYQILLAFPELMGPRNRLWLHFLSYKFGRLLLPWCLMLIAGSSFWLPAPWNVATLAFQVLFYGIAILDFVLPSRVPLKRISSPVRTFVTMMIAAVRGLAVFFVPARSLWKVTS